MKKEQREKKEGGGSHIEFRIRLQTGQDRTGQDILRVVISWGKSIRAYEGRRRG